MNWCRKFFPIVLCFLLLAGSRAQTTQSPAVLSAPQLPAPHPGLGLPAKQSLTYSVDWRVFPAGTVTFRQEADGDTQRINAEGDSIGAVNLIFRVSDRFQSSFNRRTGCSYGFSKQLIEGRRQVNSDLKFNYAQGKAILEVLTKESKADLAEVFDELVIVPDGVLWYVPFEALQF